MALSFFKSIVQKFSGKPVDWDDLEEMLIRADLGVPTAINILERLQEHPEKPNADKVVAVTKDYISGILPHDNPPLRPLPNRPKVILIVGVNGTGKTTSTAKLAHYLKSQRHSVLLVAADTFRAAAIEQLGMWAERIGVDIVRGQYNADPAALCYDAYQSAHRKNIEFVICDTAGRLHTKNNLMAELEKIKRSLAKHDPNAPHETFMVVDATTGSNALVQARQFNEITPLTGMILTKLDGSGKGGAAVAIQQELKIPTRFIGTGETLEDFAPFDADKFVNGIL